MATDASAAIAPKPWYHPENWRICLQGASRYLLDLRVPVLLLSIAVLALRSQQVIDVLLAMALEPEWGAFGLAAAAAGLFGIALWFSSRTLSNRRWLPNKPEIGRAHV